MHHLNNLVISLLFFLIPILGSTQSEFTKEHITKFKLIYQQSLKAHPSAISQKEFLEIKNRNHINNDEIKSATKRKNEGGRLSGKENTFLSEIDELKTAKQEARNLHIKALCKKYNLKEEEYDAMLKLFQSSIAFQNQVCKQV